MRAPTSAASCTPLPFLIPAYRAALAAALATIIFELVALAWIRWRFFATGFLRSFISIAIGGAIIASVSRAVSHAVRQVGADRGHDAGT